MAHLSIDDNQAYRRELLASAQNKKDDRAFANHYNRAVARKHDAAFELNRT